MSDHRHHFEITVRLRNDKSTDYGDPLETQVVRAWDLPTALAIAAQLPLHRWFPREDE